MFKKILLVAVLACTVIGCDQAGGGKTGPAPKSVSFPASPSKQATKDSFSYVAPIAKPAGSSYTETNQGRRFVGTAPEPATAPLAESVSPSKPATGNGGLSYETSIPRPTKKGYYEPKVVPYPVGKPVYVNGYYRANGTYVQPHFRSLPRR
jgi:hypothetical protein